MNQMPFQIWTLHQTCTETSPLHRHASSIATFTHESFAAAHEKSCRMLKVDVLLKD